MPQAPPRRRFYWIGNRDDSGDATIDRDVDRSGALLPGSFRGAVKQFRRDVQLGHQRSIAERDFSCRR